jgi:CRP-like cAMP-binding protein
MPNHLPQPIRNLLLSRLPAADFALLQPHLKPVDLPLRKSLAVCNRVIEHAYFLEHGFASVVVDGSGKGIEIGLIGREGMTGMAVIMGADRTPQDIFMQSAGSGWQIASRTLRRIVEQNSGLHRALLLSAHAFMLQAMSTALANGRSSIEERLARWLLMAHDRSDSDELAITHEFLAQMLAVRRPGVTVAVDALAKTGTILAGRGVITIVDRAGLERQSNGAYGMAEAEFDRLFR